MKKKILGILLLIIFITASIFIIKKIIDPGPDPKPIENEPRSLNISIFLDLSDRLVRDMTPPQMYRDTAIVNYLVDYFKQETLGPSILKSRNNLKVFCYPSPQDSEIAVLMKGLSVDIGEKNGVEKRMALEAMKTQFQQNLGQIYNETLEERRWVGCDIWDFFSNKKVDNFCIRPNARNIIVILTDGYIFHENNKIKEGHAYSYILPKTLSDKESFLIDRRNGDLKGKGVEVLVLEVNPYQKAHQNQIFEILENWFTSMGVEKVMVSETEADMVNTQTIIKNFLDNKE